MRNSLILFFFFITISVFSQGRIDSLRKYEKLRRKALKVKIDSLQKHIDSIDRREKAWRELDRRDWSVNGTFSFLLNQSTFSNWVSGGENTVATNVIVNYDFNYKKDSWKWDNKIITSFGYSYLQDQGYRKTDDRFEYNSVLAYNTGKRWYFSFLSNFITQYTRGFQYSSDDRRTVSTTLSPAYWSFGPGMFWRKNENYRVNIAPATSRFTFVSREFSGNYGVPEGKTSVYSLGFNLSAFIKYNLAKDVTMENIVQIYSDYLNNPQNIDINYQTNLFVRINKLMSLNLTLHVIIDDNARNTFQFRQVFGLGFNYTFHKI